MNKHKIGTLVCLLAISFFCETLVRSSHCNGQDSEPKNVIEKAKLQNAKFEKLSEMIQDDELENAIKSLDQISEQNEVEFNQLIIQVYRLLIAQGFVARGSHEKSIAQVEKAFSYYLKNPNQMACRESLGSVLPAYQDTYLKADQIERYMELTKQAITQLKSYEDEHKLNKATQHIFSLVRARSAMADHVSPDVRDQIEADLNAIISRLRKMTSTSPSNSDYAVALSRMLNTASMLHKASNQSVTYTKESFEQLEHAIESGAKDRTLAMEYHLSAIRLYFKLPTNSKERKKMALGVVKRLKQFDESIDGDLQRQIKYWEEILNSKRTIEP